MYFLSSKAGKLKTSMVRVPYNKLLTNLASSSRTGEYRPSVVFVRTSLRSVRTATTSGQYSPVRPSRSVSKRLLLHRKLSSFFYKEAVQSCPAPPPPPHPPSKNKTNKKKTYHFKTIAQNPYTISDQNF